MMIANNHGYFHDFWFFAFPRKNYSSKAPHHAWLSVIPNSSDFILFILCCHLIRCDCKSILIFCSFHPPLAMFMCVYLYIVRRFKFNYLRILRGFFSFVGKPIVSMFWLHCGCVSYAHKTHTNDPTIRHKPTHRRE